MKNQPTNYEEMLHEALRKMPNFFNSNVFSKALSAQGYPKYLIISGYPLKFLINNCDRGLTKRSWYKRNTARPVVKPAEPKSIFWTDEQMIAHLKSKGYEIFKRIQL